MVERRKLNKEKKVSCITVSIEPSIAGDFILSVANKNLSVSEVLRKFIIGYLKKEGKFVGNEKEK